MKSFATAVALVAVFAITSSAKAAEPVKGQISQTELSALGLDGMVTLSDAQGSEIRGKFWHPSSNSQTVVFHQINIGNGEVNRLVIYNNFSGVRIGGRNGG